MSERSDKTVAKTTKPRKPRVAKKPTSEAIKRHLNQIRVVAPKGNNYAVGYGRPSSYQAELPQMMLAYFKTQAQECLKEGEDAQGNIKMVGRKFVTFNGFAQTIGVSTSTLKSWSDAVNADGHYKYPEFREAYELCKDIQSDLIINGGLTGAYKGGFATMAAMNLMGWKNQAQNEYEHSYKHTGHEGSAKEINRDQS